MKPFKSITIVKHPRELVWATVRDRLAELAPLMDDVQKITELHREEGSDGVVRLDNLWQANPRLPAILKGSLDPDKMSWIDRAEWRPDSYECHWKIEPRYLPELIQCFGVARYEPAIGGRGTRITFEGQIGASLSSKVALPSFVDAGLLHGFESLVSTLIPNNLRKMTEAVAEFLDKT